MRSLYFRICFTAIICLTSVGNAGPGHAAIPDLERLDDYNRMIIRAMRYGNTARMVSLLKEAYEVGALPTWLLRYDTDLLSSCDADAILFTSGTLDTIGAWYLQHVGRCRRDVTVVPVGMLSHPWFVLTLAERNAVVMQCLDVGMSRIDICNGNVPEKISAPLRIPLSEPGGKRDRKTSPAYVELDLRLNSSRNFTPSSLRWFFHLLRENRFQRPVHFSLPTTVKIFSVVPSQSSLTGLTYALRSETGAAVDVGAGERILAGALELFVPDQRDFLQTRDADAVIMQYAFLCKRLADTQHQQGYFERERLLLQSMRELADSCVILDAETLDLLLQ